MGDVFGGKKKQKMHVYGELPGRSQLGQQLGGTLGGWLTNWGTGQGATYPGLSEASDLWRGAQYGANLGGARLREMLEPGWLEQTPTGLADIEAADRAQTERDIANVRRTGERQYGAYQQRLGMLPQLLNLSTSRPYQAAQLLTGAGGDFLRSILGYLSASRGTPVVTSEQGSSSASDLLKAYTALAA